MITLGSKVSKAKRNKVAEIIDYHFHKQDVQKPFNDAMPTDSWQYTDTADKLAKCVKRVFLETHNPNAFNLCCQIWLSTLERFMPGREELYMTLIADLPRPALDAVVKGFGVMMQHFCHDGRYCDLLGQVYMEIRSDWGGKAFGQFFTPWSLCIVMAQTIMTGPDLDAKIRRRELITVCDPCVGSGTMLLAAKAVVADTYGRWAARLVKTSGQDIDEVCVNMAKIQLTMTDDSYMTNLLQATVYEMRGKL